MELFGYLSFVGDVQEIATQNNQYSNEPFIVREICVHSFVTGSSNGECVPYLRGMNLRLSGRQAQTFNIAPGSLVAVEYGSICKPFVDKNDNHLRANGNLTVSRICVIQQADIDQLNRLMESYARLNNNQPL